MTSRSLVIDRLIRDLQLDLSQLWVWKVWNCKSIDLFELDYSTHFGMILEYKAYLKHRMIKPYWSINRICRLIKCYDKFTLASTCSRTICQPFTPRLTLNPRRQEFLVGEDRPHETFLFLRALHRSSAQSQSSTYTTVQSATSLKLGILHVL